MSMNSGVSNIVQTDLNEAYKFQTHSGFIKNMKSPVFSPICIYCSFNQSKSLMNDGGCFRLCLKCNKQFQARIMQ
jgi:hypothetical protein